MEMKETILKTFAEVFGDAEGTRTNLQNSTAQKVNRRLILHRDV